MTHVPYQSDAYGYGDLKCSPETTAETQPDETLSQSHETIPTKKKTAVILSQKI